MTGEGMGVGKGGGVVSGEEVVRGVRGGFEGVVRG